MKLPIPAPLVRSGTAVFTELDDQVVMLDTERGKYYELDPVGSRIWVLLEGEPSMAELLDSLTAEFEVDAETCRNDLADFLEKLVELGLVAVARDATADP